MAVDNSKCTTDHEEIRRWAEERGGRPARVAGTEQAEMLRIDFPGDPDEEETLEPISWEEFFDTFEEGNLVFFYQEEVLVN
ncbi:MAG TPA: hypothetical protein VF756_12840 [Thermoanaerobaculia bacterium]